MAIQRAAISLVGTPVRIPKSRSIIINESMTSTSKFDAGAGVCPARVNIDQLMSVQYLFVSFFHLLFVSFSASL
jgi:hypothetical protein